MKNLEGNIESGSEIIFPNDLDSIDIELISKQCKIQNATSKEQIEGFAKAYSKAKKLALDNSRLDSFTSEQVKSFILELGVLVERRNQKGFRQIPVTFKNGQKALDAEKISQAIDGFCRGMITLLKDPAEDERLNIILLYTEFEKIHPFEDGNGRVGDLIWKILKTRKEGAWPKELPPDVFNE
jgi:Fic family protein